MLPTDRVRYVCQNCRTVLYAPRDITEFVCADCGQHETRPRCSHRKTGPAINGIAKALLVLAVAGWTFVACDRHADAAQSLACDVAALARAEAGAVTAQRLAFETLDPAEGRVAREMVVAAVEQARTARALCSTAEPRAYVAPFEADADPWQTEAPAPLDATDLDATAVVLDLPAKLDALQAELSGMVRP
jgi:predicted RNA-binding Zn-ribbon protein involved in translation (DUF1610 family)